ncbi:hypothetical protein [Natronoglomus mannanivorans]|uniref:Uncharacterized protein n=1 Tax=Natronoglomus mannanivorans TaxID=2979990 RepID=A0AAP3E0H9_9EURY|nr:hypothetical protein [Halobacteria archaeon AArc-xg1-1]
MVFSDSFSRREYLAALPATTSLAGCLSDDPDLLAIGQITLLNTEERRIDVSLTVEKDGEVVYAGTAHLDARDGTQVDSTTILEPWMGEPADYVVTVSVPSIGSETFETEELVEWYGYDCTPLTVKVSADMSIWHSLKEDACSEV